MNTMTAQLKERYADRVRWIEAVLSNDENSTDEAMVKYFMVEGGLSERTARRWVARRGEYLWGER